MANSNPLLLHEELLLLALKDQKGTFASGTMHPHAIGGAVLAELLLQSRIAVEPSKKKLVDVTGAKPVGDPLLDDCLARIRTAKRRASLQTWVARFAGLPKLTHRVAEPLCRRGILRLGEDTVLLFFKRKVYPEIDPVPERKLIERLRRAIFTDSSSIDPRTTALVSLASATGILPAVFGRKELKGRKERIRQVANGELAGRATKEAIAAMHAAIMVCCVMPAVFVAT